MPLSSVVGAQSIVKPGVCTSSTRPASPYDGQVIYETDTDKTLVYNGSAWVYLSTSRANPGGLDLISSGSVSAASTITLDNVFTSTYRNYKLLINGTCSVDDIDITFRFRSSGSTNSASSYTRTYIAGATSGVSRTSSTGLTSFTAFMATGTTQVMNETTIFAPQVAIATGIQWNSGSLSTSNYQYTGNGVFTNTTQFDGFVVTPGSGTITAQYRVYGIVD